MNNSLDIAHILSGWINVFRREHDEAIKEGDKKAEQSFHWANEVEKLHHQFYTDALKAAETGKDLETKEMWVCPVCGATFEGPHEHQEEVCPICKTKKEKYLKIE